MTADFERDYDWQRGFIPAIKQILAQYLVTEAPAEEDQQRNTDLIVLKLDTVRVACRVRTYGYLSRYPDQFTIRSSRPSGAQTELAKVISGWGDYIFYGFAEAEGFHLAAWTLGHLDVFRLWHTRQLWKGQIPGEELPNGDGTSSAPTEYRIFQQGSSKRGSAAKEGGTPMALPWVRLETAWPTNPKFLMLSADRNWRAIAVYMAGLAWSGGQGQDGFIPYYALPAMFGTQREADELCQVRLWHACDGGWQINDWNEYQPSSEENKARSDKARDAALTRWHGKNGHRR